MSSKMTIVMRTDLNMRKGKMCAQAAHAAHLAITNILGIGDINQFQFDWFTGNYTKIVVGCNSEKQINNLAEKAKENNINYAIVVDCGITEFKGVDTITCIAIGPDDSEKIDKITNHLKLL